METYGYGSLAHAIYNRILTDREFEQKMRKRIKELCSSSHYKNNLEKKTED